MRREKGAGVASADCVDGVRDATPDELGFAARAEAALAAALPAPVANSERRGAPYDFSRQPRLSFCRGAGEGAFSSSASGGYLYKFPNAEADRMYAEYDAAPRRSRKDPPFTAEQQAQADRANAEGRKLEEAANKFVADHKAGVKPQSDPLRAQAKRLDPGDHRASRGVCGALPGGRPHNGDVRRGECAAQ